MGLFDKVEKGLERTVNRAFAKAFRSEVQPIEIAGAIRNAMDDRASVLGPGRTMVPNRYTIELSTTDFGRLDEFADSITEDLVAAAAEHAETQRYLPGGPIEVILLEGSDLDTGVFRVRPETSRRAPSAGMPPAARPVAPPAAPPAPAAAPAAADPGIDLLPDRAPAPPPPQPAAPPLGAPVPGAPPPGGPVAAAPVAGAPVAPPVMAPPVVAPVAPPPPPAMPAPTPQMVAPPPPGKLPRINPAERPWLDIDGERYPLLGSLTVIGRDATADIILDDPGISRRHSEIRVTHDGPHLVSSIRDLASTNGTFLNGERIAVASSRLADGDHITIGRTAIVFRAGKR